MHWFHLVESFYIVMLSCHVLLLSCCFQFPIVVSCLSVVLFPLSGCNVMFMLECSFYDLNVYFHGTDCWQTGPGFRRLTFRHWRMHLHFRNRSTGKIFDFSFFVQTKRNQQG